MRIIVFGVLLIIASVTTAHGRQHNSARDAVSACLDPANEKLWNNQEKSVWEQISRGKTAELASLPDSKRTLRSCVVQEMLRNEKFSKQLFRNGVTIDGAYFEEQFDLSNATIDFPLRLQHCIFAHGADFSMLRSKHLLDLEGSTFDGDKNSNKNTIDMDSMEIDGDLLMYWGQYRAAIDLSSAIIHGNVDFSGSKFDGNVDMTWARVDNGLILSSDDNKAPGVSLDLTKMQAHEIPAFKDDAGWPDKFYLNGLTYQSIDKATDAIDVNTFENWFDQHAENVSLQPYEQLASVYQAQGNADGAKAIRFAGKDHDRKTANGWRSVLLHAHYALIGYGYIPSFSLVWALVFTAIGVLVLTASRQGRVNDMRWRIIYSFDMLLPLVRLRESNYAVDLEGRPAYYFYFHKILGFALAGFIGATLAGLTK
jgi:hypothetical protein